MELNKLFKMAIACFLLSGVLFFSCSDDDDVPEDKKLSLLYMTQSRDCWNGTTSNYFIDVREDDGSDIILNIGMGLYRNHKDGIEAVTADLKIDSDSLDAAIQKAKDGNSAFTIYQNAKLLPAAYYTVPDKISLAGGQETGEVQIVLKRSEILKDAHTTKGGYFIIPLKLANPTKYRLNDNVYFTMFILRFPDNELDPTKPDPSNPPELEGYTLYWSDEFNIDGKPDETKWNFEKGFARNEELQWYQSDNAICEGGALIITGKKERVKNPNYEAGSSDWRKNREYAEYTSTSMTTHNKMSYTFGRLEVRAKIPTGMGAWPAIWMLGTVGDWPFDGEIDVLEYYLKGGEPHIHANFCWGGGSRWESKWNSYSEPFTNFTDKNPNWANEYHVWVYEWDETMSRFYIDDKLFREVWTNSMWNGGGHGYTDPETGQWKTDWRDPFHWPHYVLLNLAIGRNGGTPDDSAFPMKYEVDYVRVYQKN